MPRLTAPSDYSKEPLRHPCLKINSKASLIEPFNVELTSSALTCSYVTPNFFYKRNHGPIPIVEDIESFARYVVFLCFSLVLHV
ncbi:hypothetical protein Ahy_A02g006774 [Arachis hypogaea]|uniref:Uncharacterized protein n=1 Tax=Arachis hypogaea TaxID=3818 RepID=A0A445EAQ1_ARAHY|nr:hypothetical protein Ahy_A02g006774 [Arachis hypogaea]